MGVRHLKAFMISAVERGGHIINIKKEIAIFKSVHNKSPVLVINTKGFMKCLYGNKENRDMIFGGRFVQYYNKIETFLRTLKECDATLVFFHSEFKSDKLQNSFMATINRTYRRTCALYDEIVYDGVSIDDLTDPVRGKSEKWLPIISTVHIGLLKLFSKYGRVVNALESFCDLQLAQYAYAHQALAVIGDNSDYLIYKGTWKYWSSTDLHLDTYECLELCRTALLKRTQLRPHQLGLFATICGNDFLPYEDVRDFHGELGPTFDYKKFKVISQYVQQFKEAKLTSEELKQITLDVYKMYDKSKLQIIKSSVDAYDYDTLKVHSINYDNRILQEWRHSPIIYNILAERIYHLIPKYLDFRIGDGGILPLIDILSPILKRQLGVLLKYKCDTEEIKCSVLTIKNDIDMAAIVEITPIYPNLMNISNEHHFEIINKRGSVDAKEYKWKLLFWMVSNGKLDENDIKGIPNNYLVDVLTLYYLVQMNQIKIFEADILLVTMDTIIKKGIPDKITYPKNLNKRTILLAHLYVQTYDYIFRCFEILRFENKVEHIKFDGVYFHNLMDILMDDDDSIPESMYELNSYRIYS